MSESRAALRLFFALWPDTPARLALSRLAREVAHDAHGRAIRDDNLHVTLAFLGNVAQDRLPALLEAGARAALSAPAFPLRLQRLGGGSYAVTWFTPEVVPAPLRALHDALAGELSGMGFTVERRMFRPHVTLARDCVRSPKRGRLPAIEWRVDRLSLVASTSAPGGSVYREVQGWPLARVAGGS